MKNFIKISFMFLLSIPLAQAKQIVSECLAKRKYAIKGYVCREINPERARNLTVKYVCAYHEGKWHRGTWYGKKNEFKSERVCEMGVKVINTPDETNEVGPFLDVKVRPYQGKETNISQQMLKNNEIPVSCYRGISTSSGMPKQPVACSIDPESKNFCEMVNVENSDLVHQTHKNKYRGFWWVVFTREGKKSPKICHGGVIKDQNISRAGDASVRHVDKLTSINAQEEPFMCYLSKNSTGQSIEYRNCKQHACTEEGTGLNCCHQTKGSNNKLVWVYNESRTKAKVCEGGVQVASKTSTQSIPGANNTVEIKIDEQETQKAVVTNVNQLKNELNSLKNEIKELKELLKSQQSQDQLDITNPSVAVE